MDYAFCLMGSDNMFKAQPACIRNISVFVAKLIFHPLDMLINQSSKSVSGDNGLGSGSTKTLAGIFANQ